MRLRPSAFLHHLSVGEGRVLLVHGLSGAKLVVTEEAASLVLALEEGLRLPDDLPALSARFPYTPDQLAGALSDLHERGFLTELDPEAERATQAAIFGPTFGRDPAALLERYQRQRQQGGESYWAVNTAMGLERGGEDLRRVEAILFGDCDLQMEADFLRQAARDQGVDLRIAATFPDDVRFAGDHPHEVIFVGALRARHQIGLESAQTDPENPHYALYIQEAQRLIAGLRQYSKAPVLIDNLPLPTVQPLGLAERGVGGHRNRFHMANLTLSQMVETFDDVVLVDLEAAFAAAGTERLLDDAQVGFTHFGSPGWMLQRPESEKAAVHNLFPDPAPLVDWVQGDPYRRERVAAKAHADALVSVLGIGRKKAVIVDLDGTLWPGVLAETGSPFNWSPDLSGAFSYIGLYFGLHEALKCLKRRGLVLACVSKNDEATVRELWTYPDHYPRERLLSPDDFVTWRVNWHDKVDNITNIATELGFALDTFLFIDDHPVERDRVRTRLPEVEVWGEDLFGLRRRLLTDPRLQTPRVTGEAGQRTELTKAQLERQAARTGQVSEAEYRASLNIRVQVTRLTPEQDFTRVRELFERTTQFNTTGRTFSSGELRSIAAQGQGGVFAVEVWDRFGAQGLVGAAVVSENEILALALSCRVLGMGVEARFLGDLLAHFAGHLAGRIIETARNIPVRRLYQDHGFLLGEDGVWRHAPVDNRS